MIHNQSQYFHITFPPLEDARFTVYEEEREMIAIYVSTCGLQNQSNRGNVRSNEVITSPRHYIEGTNSYDKTSNADFPGVTGARSSIIPGTRIFPCESISDDISWTKSVILS